MMRSILRGVALWTAVGCATCALAVDSIPDWQVQSAGRKRDPDEREVKAPQSMKLRAVKLPGKTTPEKDKARSGTWKGSRRTI